MTTATEDALREQIAYRDNIIKALTCAGENPVPGLQQRESEVYRTLERANGRALSAQAIADGIHYRNPNPPAYTSINVLVCRIRKARPDIAARLQTCGNGYRLVPV